MLKFRGAMLHSYIDIPLDSFTQVYTVLSLPELKAQVIFSDCLLSLCKLFTFSSSPEQLSPPSPISTKLDNKHPFGDGESSLFK